MFVRRTKTMEKPKGNSSKGRRDKFSTRQLAKIRRIIAKGPLPIRVDVNLASKLEINDLETISRYINNQPELWKFFDQFDKRIVPTVIEKRQEKVEKQAHKEKLELDLEKLKKVAMVNGTLGEYAAVLNISLSALRDRMEEDPKVKAIINQGELVGRYAVRKAVYEMAVNKESPSLAVKFLEKKTRDWKDDHEEKQEIVIHAHVGDSGQIVQKELSEEDKIALMKRVKGQ